MNRREFLKSIGIMAGTTLLPFSTAKLTIPSNIKNPLKESHIVYLSIDNTPITYPTGYKRMEFSPAGEGQISNSNTVMFNIESDWGVVRRFSLHNKDGSILAEGEFDHDMKVRKGDTVIISKGDIIITS